MRSHRQRGLSGMHLHSSRCQCHAAVPCLLCRAPGAPLALLDVKMLGLPGEGTVLLALLAAALDVRAQSPAALSWHAKIDLILALQPHKAA